MDAVQQGYGVIVPEQMVAWEGGETIAWWQLDLETGETVGVGENGTHDFITFTTMFLAGSMMQLQLVQIIILLWRLLVWLEVASITWEYFRQEAKQGLAGIESEGELGEIYRDALNRTKVHMQTRRQWVHEFLQ